MNSGMRSHPAHAAHLARPDARIASAPMLAAVALLTAWPELARAADGDVDGSFGVGGIAAADFSGRVDAASATAVQADGKIVVAGSTVAFSSSDFALARYGPRGVLDPSFGAGGKVTTDFGARSSATSIALQPDGKIVAAGKVARPGTSATSFALARYGADGTLDATFGTGGKISAPFTTPAGGGSAAIEAIALQPDGKIVVAGSVLWDPATGLTVHALARYLADGSLDPSFGSGGWVAHMVGGSCSNSSSRALAIAVQPDGKLVTSGWAIVECPARRRWAVTRYHPAGAVDTSFNGTGKVFAFTLSGTLPRAGWDGSGASGALVQPDGRIVAAGPAIADGVGVFGVLRLEPGGGVDMTFGTSGTVTTAIGTAAAVYDLALQEDGKIVVAGEATVGTETRFAAARYAGDGTLDAGFGVGGTALASVGAGAAGVNATALQRDGKLLLAGFSANDFKVVRLAGTDSGSALTVNAIRTNRGGNMGTVTATLFGSHIVEGATVRLVRAGEPDLPARSVNVAAGGLSASVLLDLHGAALGAWDVVVTNRIGSTATLPAAFTVEPVRAPRGFASILGRSVVRPRTTQVAHVHVGNRGNVDAVFPLWIAFALDPDTGEPLGSLGFAPYHGPLGPLDEPVDFGELPRSFRTADAVVHPMLVYVPAGGELMLPVSVRPLCGDPPRAPLSAGIGDPLDAERLSGNCALDLLGLAAVFVPGSSCVKGPAQAILNDRLREKHGTPVTLSSFAFDLWVNALKCAMEFFPPAKGVLIVWNLYDALAASYSAGGTCGETAGLVPPMRSALTTTCVSSRDPNDKVGPAGEGGPGRHVPGSDRLGYTVFFENVPDATAPAQTVVITDQLDAGTVDLGSFSLGPVTLGSTVVVPPPGVSAFEADVDLRPGRDLIARVHAALDVRTGLLTCRFDSIDPVTMAPTTDPLGGILPPNVAAPAGEGSVSYTVTAMAGLPTGTRACNRAIIVFDDNEPIETAEWCNTVDDTAPLSEVTPLASEQMSREFAVSWSGTDEGSGVAEFSVLVSEDDGPFVPWLTRTLATSGVFTGEVGRSYAFYSVARDLVGNEAAAAPVAQATTRVVEPPVQPRSRGGCSSAPGGAAGLVGLLVLALRRRSPA
jgi:uncharacterized delta-60 repeat protein